MVVSIILLLLIFEIAETIKYNPQKSDFLSEKHFQVCIKHNKPILKFFHLPLKGYLNQQWTYDNPWRTLWSVLIILPSFNRPSYLHLIIYLKLWKYLVAIKAVNQFYFKWTSVAFLVGLDLVYFGICVIKNWQSSMFWHRNSANWNMKAKFVL